MTNRENTLAKQHYAVLAANRFDQLESMIDTAIEIGDDTARSMLEEVRELWPTIGDPLAGVLRECTDSVTASMRMLGVSEDQLRTVCVGGTSQDDVAAQMSPFSDGSGLVLVSDAIMSLIHMYCRYAARVLSSLVSGSSYSQIPKMWKMVKSGDGDHHILAGLLRYHHVHQRAFGLAAKMTLLLDEDAWNIADLLSMHAWRFVIAHEIAHHALGHSAKPRAFSTSERLPVCSNEQQLELDADLLGLRATTLCAEQYDGAHTHTLTGIGALIAMLAVQSVEQALLVRTGCTHPPSEVRMRILLNNLSPRQRRTVQIVTESLRQATVRASDFDSPYPADGWKRVMENAEVCTSHSTEYLNMIVNLDRIQSISRDNLLAFFRRLDKDYTTNMLAGGELAVSGKPASALQSWRVPDDCISRLCDFERALSFRGLQDAIFSGVSQTYELGPTISRGYSLSAAALVRNQLGNGN